MSTGALITVSIAWSYILVVAVYFFVKVVKKDKERAKLLNQKTGE